MKINLSFKNNELEKSMYIFVKSKMNYSVYLKELIMIDMKKAIRENLELKFDTSE